MPAINFKKEFAPKVASGEKRQTIRSRRKNGNPAEGDKLYLYTGMRTKHCKKLGEATCLSVSEICITDDKDVMFLDGELLTVEEERAMATADGFESVADFRGFFWEQYGLPFYGLLIKW